MQSLRQSSAKWGPSHACDSYRLREVHRRHTRPELAVRRLLHSLGYRFRLHRTDLPGEPDLVFPGRRKIILVHGCFWHRHRCARGRSMPVANKHLWLLKFSATQQRDRRNLRGLRDVGWDVLVIWECQLAAKKRCSLINTMCNFLNSICQQRQEQTNAPRRGWH
jgi:DNA mismatch endonuclease (patch repair protein)